MAANGSKVDCRQAESSWLGADRGDDVDELGLAGDLHAICVAQQADEESADDDGVDDRVVVLDERRRAVVAQSVLAVESLLVPDVPLVERQRQSAR